MTDVKIYSDNEMVGVSMDTPCLLPCERCDRMTRTEWTAKDRKAFPYRVIACPSCATNKTVIWNMIVEKSRQQIMTEEELNHLLRTHNLAERKLSQIAKTNHNLPIKNL